VGGDDTHRTIGAIWRIESPKVIARLSRLLGDVGVAEDVARDAFVAALKRWPKVGIPDNPGAWLMTTARYLAIDLMRRRDKRDEKYAELGVTTDRVHVDFDTAVNDDVGDDLLGLIFMACHPVLPNEARVALTLRLLGGLSTAEIARGYLVSETTVAQRIVRAKRTLAATGVRFELPDATERATRLASVLEVIYLVFNEGYTATAGDDWMRSELCAEAMRLGADQYVVWPQRRREMVARLRAVLPRANGYDPEAFNHQPFQVGDLHLDPRGYIASLAGRRIQLTPREFELLQTLVLHAGRPVSKPALAAHVWGADYDMTTRRLEHNIARVRRKLQANGGGTRVVSERGVGWRYQALAQRARPNTTKTQPAPSSHAVDSTAVDA
jgi:RNA polymerase sigma factor (sigma-70 family)